MKPGDDTKEDPGKSSSTTAASRYVHMTTQKTRKIFLLADSVIINKQVLVYVHVDQETHEIHAGRGGDGVLVGRIGLSLPLCVSDEGSALTQLIVRSNYICRRELKFRRVLERRQRFIY